MPFIGFVRDSLGARVQHRLTIHKEQIAVTAVAQFEAHRPTAIGHFCIGVASGCQSLKSPTKETLFASRASHVKNTTECSGRRDE